MSTELAPEEGAARRSGRRRGWLVGGAVALVAGALVIAAIALVGSWRAASLQNATDAVARGLERGVAQAIFKVEAVGGLFRASTEVTPEEFALFASRLDLDTEPDSLAVALRVEGDDFEAFAERFESSYPGASLFEIRPGGERIPLRGHSGTRYIVAFYASKTDEFSALGFDMVSEQNRRFAVRRAAEEGVSVVSNFVQLVDGVPEDGFLAVAPVEDHDGNHLGVAVAAAEIGSMLDVWVPESIKGGTDIRVIDGPASSTVIPSGRFSPVATSPIEVPGAEWTVVGAMKDTGGSLMWMAVVGLLISLLLGVVAGTLLSTYLTRRALRGRLRWTQLLAEERQRSIEALSAFELLAENSSDIIARHTPDLRHLYVSPSIVSLLGYGPDDLIGHRPWKQFHPEDVAIVEAMVAELTAGAERSEMEARMQHADGHWLWFHTTARAIRDESGGLVEIQTASRDVTERIAQRQELARARQEAEEASAAKGRFLSSVSHEVRTPLSAIAGMTELLAETGLDPDQREYLDTITSSAASVVTLVSDLLDMTKAEHGQLHLESIPFDVSAVVTDVVRMFRVTAAEKAVELVVDVDPGVPDRLVGDPHRIRQVLVNLVGNALKFTETGSVSIRLVVASVASGSAELRMEVIDTGIGIPADRVEAIFEDFEQADLTISRRFGGSGLGLGISRQLVHMMGGTLTVESEPGSGSTFSVVLELPLALLVEGRECTVVGAVEDRESAATLLTEKGWSVIRAARRDPVEQTGACVVIGSHAYWAEEELAGAVVVDTSPRRGNAERAKRRGAIAYVGFPCGPEELAGLVELSLTAPDFVTRHDLGEPVQRLRILAADDAPSNRLLVERMLARRGHEVVSVGDGAQALALFQQEAFDVVLLDGRMPVMSGVEATREIRRLDSESGRHTPVVALTGMVTDEERADVMAAGADMWIAKPFDSTRLYQVVEKVAGRPAVVEALVRSAAVLDIEAFRSQVAEMPELAAELAAAVKEEWAELADSLTPAQTEADPEAAAAAAHRLRGVLSVVGATDAATEAARLESAVKAGALGEAVAAAASLTGQQQAVESVLDEAVEQFSGEGAHPNR